MSSLLGVRLDLAQPWVQEVSLPQQTGVMSGRQVAHTQHDVCPLPHPRPQAVALPREQGQSAGAQSCHLSADAAVSLCTLEDPDASSLS